MPNESEIQAVMVNADCDRRTALRALERCACRVGAAIRYVVAQVNIPGARWCGSCGELMAEGWSYCPYCGERLQKEQEG